MSHLLSDTTSKGTSEYDSEYGSLAAACEEFARDERDAWERFSILEQYQKRSKPGDVGVRKLREEYIEEDMWGAFEGAKELQLKTIEDSRCAYRIAFDRLRVFSGLEAASLASILDYHAPVCRSLNRQYYHEGV